MPEVKQNGIIDDMFQKLDADGNNTLDFTEITALLHDNQINMTIEQVAYMFGEARRSHERDIYKKYMQNGLYSKSDPRSIVKKGNDYY